MLKPLPGLIVQYDLKIKGVIHIGGHRGQEYKYYKECGIPNIVFVEPHPINFEVMKENVGKECLLFNVALGNKQGEVEMFVEEANEGQSSSILEPYMHLSQYPNIPFLYKIDVPITLLDLLAIDRTLYNFINIDVQGYELEVFMGGTSVLSKMDYIYSEVNRDELYRNCAKVEEIDAILAASNFERIETWWDGVTWGDALYMKK